MEVVVREPDCTGNSITEVGATSLSYSLHLPSPVLKQVRYPFVVGGTENVLEKSRAVFQTSALLSSSLAPPQFTSSSVKL